MKTDKYIYWYEQRKYYLVRFTIKGKYIQKVIPVTSNRTKKQALKEAYEYRDNNIELRKLIGLQYRALNWKPAKNKKDKRFPAGISHVTKSKRGDKYYNCNRINITLGCNEKGKTIIRTINVNKFPSLEKALERAIVIRAELKEKYNKY